MQFSSIMHLKQIELYVYRKIIFIEITCVTALLTLLVTLIFLLLLSFLFTASTSVGITDLCKCRHSQQQKFKIFKNEYLQSFWHLAIFSWAIYLWFFFMKSIYRNKNSSSRFFCKSLSFPVVAFHFSKIVYFRIFLLTYCSHIHTHTHTSFFHFILINSPTLSLSF